MGQQAKGNENIAFITVGSLVARCVVYLSAEGFLKYATFHRARVPHNFLNLVLLG